MAVGAEQIRIAGDVPHEGNGGRFAGWDRYESAVNAVWQDYPVYSRCLYDATTVAASVRDVVERTHRRVLTADGRVTTSRHYQEVPDSLKQIRRRVAGAAHGRVDPDAFDQLMFALSEAVINAQLYGRPPVTVRAWTEPDRIVVHVHDAGPGPGDTLTGLVAAPDGAGGAGLGLWLAHQLSGIDIALLSDDGFTVRLRACRPAAR